MQPIQYIIQYCGTCLQMTGCNQSDAFINTINIYICFYYNRLQINIHISIVVLDYICLVVVHNTYTILYYYDLLHVYVTMICFTDEALYK